MTNAAWCGIFIVKRYSVSEAARILNVDRRTLQRWVSQRLVPEPTTENIANMRVRFWNEQEFQKVKEHKARQYWRKRKQNTTGK